MKNKKDRDIDNYLAANQRLLFRFVTNLILLGCIMGLMYGIFGESMQDIFETNSPVSEVIQKENRRKRRAAQPIDNSDRVENGIHVQTGLVFAEGFKVVRGTCTGCHSAKLITQNRADRSGWQDMIRWMQETQGLWNLGKNEPIILDYLSKHYAPRPNNRRPNLDIAALEWYILDLED